MPDHEQLPAWHPLILLYLAHRQNDAHTSSGTCVSMSLTQKVVQQSGHWLAIRKHCNIIDNPPAPVVVESDANDLIPELIFYASGHFLFRQLRRFIVLGPRQSWR
jgi:hypothetical protein